MGFTDALAPRSPRRVMPARVCSDADPSASTPSSTGWALPQNMLICRTDPSHSHMEGGVSGMERVVPPMILRCRPLPKASSVDVVFAARGDLFGELGEGFFGELGAGFAVGDGFVGGVDWEIGVSAPSLQASNGSQAKCCQSPDGTHNPRAKTGIHFPNPAGEITPHVSFYL